jgi:hypothetical protein
MLVIIKVIENNSRTLFKRFLLEYMAHIQQLEAEGKPSYIDLGLESAEDIDSFLLASKEFHFTFKHPLAGYYLMFEEGKLNRAIGMVYLESTLHDGLMEESICFLPHACGKGYGEEAIRKIIALAEPFVTTKLPFLDEKGQEIIQTLRGVFAGINVNNLPSVVAHSRSGMTLLNYLQISIPDSKPLHGVILNYPEDTCGCSSQFPQFEKHQANKPKLLRDIEPIVRQFKQRNNTKQVATEWTRKFTSELAAYRTDPGVSMFMYASLQCQKKDASYFKTKAPIEETDTQETRGKSIMHWRDPGACGRMVDAKAISQGAPPIHIAKP